MQDLEKSDEDRRIAEVLQIAESLAVGERQASDIHDGYTRLGQATHGSFRFKWVAREQADGRYVVEELVGSSAVAVKSLPMPIEEVLGYIDERQRLHFQKIEAIRREWTSVRTGSPMSADAMALSAGVPERDPAEIYDEIRRMLTEKK